MAAATFDDRAPDCFPIFCTMLAIAAFILSMAGMSYIVFYGPSTPIYSVAIDSASGLDLPVPDLALEPRFNLTLRVTSESLGVGGCLEAGTFLEVSYRCNMLAATSEQLCAEPTESREVSFVARGTDVRLPGYVMDNLVADMRNGVHAFEVTVRRSDSNYDDVMLVSCGGRQVGGDASAALETQCHASHFCPDQDRGRRVVARLSPKHVSSLSMIM
uniref:Uncharacterized protein n=1 Tax=Avena sativa TaxID=4498 RepID=A0ACD5V706_AVESA